MQAMERALNGFRKQFPFSNLPLANWFPGHMAKGSRNIARRLQFCDCVIEVHDARLGPKVQSDSHMHFHNSHSHIPFSGRNPNLKFMLRGRPKLLVLNKMDLADPRKSEDVLQSLREAGEREILFTNLRKQHDSTINQLMKNLLDIVGWTREQTESDSEYNVRLMVVGMPNVGKSSLINALRRNYTKQGKAARVGKLPGITRAVSTKIQVNKDPKMYLVDTPGVMIPNITNPELALKLAVAGMLKDHLIGETLIADYLLYILNKQQHFEYVDYYRLELPSDDIEFVLTATAKRIGALMKGGVFDRTRAAQHFLRKFREGQLGRLTLDTVTSDKI